MKKLPTKLRSKKNKKNGESNSYVENLQDKMFNPEMAMNASKKSKSIAINGNSPIKSHQILMDSDPFSS
jgi:hypothetical protein